MKTFYENLTWIVSSAASHFPVFIQFHFPLLRKSFIKEGTFSLIQIQKLEDLLARLLLKHQGWYCDQQSSAPHSRKHPSITLKCLGSINPCMLGWFDQHNKVSVERTKSGLQVRLHVASPHPPPPHDSTFPVHTLYGSII